MTVKIYHNPKCSKSRQTLALIRERGIEPEIIEYLETPLSPEELKRIIDRLGIAPAELLRTGESEYRELGLDGDDVDDTAVIEAMRKHPRLMQRPIVVVGDDARIGRPPEAVIEILP